MPEIDTTKEAVETLGKEVAPDVFELADLYAQLEFLLRNVKKIPPTAEAIEAMAVSLFIQRNRDKQPAASGKARSSTGSSDSGAPNDKKCPDCGRMVKATKSGRTGKYYYKCPECNVFVNRDGTTTPANKK